MKKSSIILLIMLVSLAVILNFLPRVHYNYPLHVDEYVHFQYSNYLSSNSPLYFNQEYKNNLESGFHYLLATLNSFGVEYLFMFRFFSSIMTILICLSVFILARKIFNEKAALFAVFFVGLLESSVAILGPMFFVPMSLGMFFIAISLFLIKNNSKAWVLILASILIIHPPSAMALLLLINIEFLMVRKNYAQNIVLQILAGIIALPLYYDIFLTKKMQAIDYLSFTSISSPLFIPRFLGYFALIIIILGIYFSSEKKHYSIPGYIIGLLAFIFIFYHYKLELFIPYARALMYLFLIFSIVFGYGCYKITGISDNRKIKTVITLGLILLILILMIPGKIESTKKVYHIMEDKDYLAFNFIKENITLEGLAVADPWKANALTPFAERAVYSRIVQGPSEFYEARNNEIKEFFDDNCNNTDFLEENNIRIIYGSCNNDKLEEVYENVYVYDKPVNKVTRIIDGDTFELGNGDKVRLICVNTPEKGEDGYEEAKDYLSSLILNKTVILEKDVSDTDQYNRLLRYVYVNEDNKEIFINKELVKSGFAKVARYKPDVRRCDEIENNL